MQKIPNLRNNIPPLLKHCIFILNQIFEIERKVDNLKEKNSIKRNIDNLKDYFKDSSLLENAQLEIYNPLGEEYNETRTDCDASISGKSVNNLIIEEVIKPIIHYNNEGRTTIVQRAVVIVRSKKRGE